MKNRSKYLILCLFGILILCLVALVTYKIINDHSNDETDQLSDTKEEKLVDTIKKSHVKNIGQHNAKNQIIVFTDYRCPHCYDFHQSEKDELYQLINKGKIKYAEIPYRVIDRYSDQFANADKAASKILNDKEYWQFKNKAYKEAAKQSPNVENIIDDQKVKVEYQKIRNNTIDNSIAEEVNVNSTPTIFLNGKVVSSMKELKSQLK